jgi:hypothetical protein
MQVNSGNNYKFFRTPIPPSSQNPQTANDSDIENEQIQTEDQNESSQTEETKAPESIHQEETNDSSQKGSSLRLRRQHQLNNQKLLLDNLRNRLQNQNSETPKELSELFQQAVTQKLTKTQSEDQNNNSNSSN